MDTFDKYSKNTKTRSTGYKRFWTLALTFCTYLIRPIISPLRGTDLGASWWYPRKSWAALLHNLETSNDLSYCRGKHKGGPGSATEGARWRATLQPHSFCFYLQCLWILWSNARLYHLLIQSFPKFFFFFFKKLAEVLSFDPYLNHRAATPGSPAKEGYAMFLGLWDLTEAVILCKGYVHV